MPYLPSRARLLALAARNQVGRMLGTPGGYTAAQRATAQILWRCGMGVGWDDDTCAAFLGNVDGECSFLIHAWGDKDQATDMEQDHKPRRDMILEHAHIDMVTADAADQFRGIFWEMTTAPSPYRHNNDLLKAAVGIPAKVTILVAKEEQSGSQARDIARRTAMAIFWKSQFGAAA